MINYIFYFLGQLFLLLLTCKLFEVNLVKQLSWWYIFSPIILMVIIPFSIILLGIIMNIIFKKKSKKK